MIVKTESRMERFWILVTEAWSQDLHLNQIAVNRIKQSQLI